MLLLEIVVGPCVALIDQISCHWSSWLGLIRLQELDGARRLLLLLPPCLQWSVSSTIDRCVKLLVAIGQTTCLVPLELLDHTSIIKKRRYLHRINIASIIGPLWRFISLLCTLHAIISVVLIALRNNPSRFWTLKHLFKVYGGVEGLGRVLSLVALIDLTGFN